MAGNSCDCRKPTVRNCSTNDRIQPLHKAIQNAQPNSIGSHHGAHTAAATNTVLNLSRATSHGKYTPRGALYGHFQNPRNCQVLSRRWHGYSVHHGTHSFATLPPTCKSHWKKTAASAIRWRKRTSDTGSKGSKSQARKACGTVVQSTLPATGGTYLQPTNLRMLCELVSQECVPTRWLAPPPNNFLPRPVLLSLYLYLSRFFCLLRPVSLYMFSLSLPLFRSPSAVAYGTCELHLCRDPGTPAASFSIFRPVRVSMPARNGDEI